MHRDRGRAQGLPSAGGLFAAIALVAACTGAAYPLKQITVVVSLGVV